MAQRITEFFSSKAANTAFVSGNYVAPVFFFNNWDNETAESPISEPILIGAGSRTATVDQQHNVTPVISLGHYDILQHVAHHVQANTFQVGKALLFGATLERLGIAAYGQDVLESPYLECILVDWRYFAANGGGANRVTGVDAGFSNGVVPANVVRYLRLRGLTLKGKNMNVQTGDVIMENCQFTYDQAERVPDDAFTTRIITMLRLRQPRLYRDFAALNGQFRFEDGR
jgi:hypothetical protein